MTSFLVIDDDDRFRKRLARALSDRNFSVRETGSPQEAMVLVRTEKPSHVILDLKIPQMSGLEILKEIKKISHDLKIVILTGYGSIATALEAIKAGAINYVTKPADLDRILAAFSGDAHKEVVSVPSLSRVEWEHIERVMQECGGNVSKAAKLLKMHRRSLQRKLKAPPPVT